MEVMLRIVLAITIFTTMAAVASSAASPVTFVFGDSLTEVGNNNYLQYSLARSNYPWYGVDYAGGQATGRFTNGRTIGDIICSQITPHPYFSFPLLPLFQEFIILIIFSFGNFVAEKLGIPSPPPYLSVSQNDDALLKGVNYASGGAGILNDTGLYFVSIFLLFIRL